MEVFYTMITHSCSRLYNYRHLVCTVLLVGTVDTEVKVFSAENPEVKVATFKLQVGQNTPLYASPATKISSLKLLQ